MRVLCLLVVLAVALTVGEARRRKCWHCENARSSYECHQTGFLETCLVNQHTCQHENRSIASASYYEFTKRCKQDPACPNNERQNYTGSPSPDIQCLQYSDHEVCRCCCNWDNCNHPYTTCLKEKPNCGPPPGIENGVVTCSNDSYPVGTQCCYKCLLGFKIEGEPVTECIQGGNGSVYWDPEPPVCEAPKECLPPRVDPANGNVTCTDGNNIDSVCTFMCHRPYVIAGWETNVCTKWGQWDNPPPTCEIVQCREPGPVHINSTWTCTNKYYLDSVCTYACAEGMSVVGENPITCLGPGVGRYGGWDYRPPQCDLNECIPPVQNKTHTLAFCNNKNLVGSTCTIVCKPRQGWWMPHKGENTTVSKVVAHCQTDETWSERIDFDCEPIECPPQTFLANGNIDCKNGFLYKSRCHFTCNRNYTLVGTLSNLCVETPPIGDGFGKWDKEMPFCRKDCPKPSRPGFTFICEAGTQVGKKCTAFCDPTVGQYMARQVDGKEVVITGEEVECKEGGTWETTSGYAFAECKPITCIPPTVAPGNGSATCSDENNYLSFCEYDCNDDYDLKGIDERTCEDDRPPTGFKEQYGRWSSLPPTCELAKCRVIPEREGVIKTCSDGVNVGSVCTFRCEDENKEIIGNRRVECKRDYRGADPDWDPEPNARCEMKPCQAYGGEDIPARAGKLTCDPPNAAGLYEEDSTCKLTCKRQDGFSVMESDTSTCFQGRWTDEGLCCVECIKNDNIDILFLLDGGDDAVEWDDKKSFLMDFIGQLRDTYTLKMNITFVEYGATVDDSTMKTHVYEDAVGGSYNPLDVEAALDELSGSLGNVRNNLGAALRWANEDFFYDWTYQKVPMVIVMTTRDPADPRLVISTARAMKARYIPLRLLPLTSRDVLDDTVLTDLSTFADFIVTYGEGDILLTAAADGISDQTKPICNEANQNLQPCVRS